MKQINDNTWQSDNGLITFVLGDCMQFMEEFNEDEFDLACVDPVYGELVVKGGYMKNTSSKLAKNKNYGNTLWKQQKTTKEYFIRLFMVCKNSIVWGGNYFSEEIATNKSCWLVWDKDNGDNNFADCELAWTSFNTATRIYKWKWQGMLQQNMKNKQIRIHETEKPVQLYRWIFKNYAKPTDHILDTHGGSMSSAIAAHMEGLRMTIIELDPECFAKAIQRFSIYEAQQTINFV